MIFQNIYKRFRLKYLVVPPTPAIIKGKKHIACIGDSTTFGAGVKGVLEQTWAYYLNQKLGDEYQVLNYGINARTLQKEGDYPYINDKFYRESKRGCADIYLIMLGTNDAKPYNWNAGRFEQQLDSFCDEYIRLKHHPRVILMTPPHCFADRVTGVVGFDIDGNILNNEVPEIVKRTAETKGLLNIDLNSLTSDHEEWFADGVHPNAAGNYRIAEYIAEMLSNTSN